MSQFKITIPTEQSFDMIFHFSNEYDFRQFRNLVANGGQQTIGNYTLKVKNNTIILFKKRDFSGANYEMSTDNVLEKINSKLSCNV